jgi:DNA-3-methyladenine glycosylase II
VAGPTVLGMGTNDVRREIDLPLSGRFDLQESIGFGFGQRSAGTDEVMRLAFCLDGLEHQVGVAVRQPSPDRLGLEVVADPEVDLEAVRTQVARVLSVDLDGTAYDELGRRDALVGRVQAARPGLRPPLFYSAYEAALWAILSARQPHAQMAAARERLAREYGRVFEVAGQELAAVPLPSRLAELGELAGVREGKAPRLRELAAVAAEGRLETADLRALPPAEAEERLQELPGIGPFYSELVVVRALGHADLLARHEPMVRDLIGQVVGAPEPLSDTEFEQVTDTWRPWRTWVTVAVRAGAAQLGLSPRRGRLTRGGPAA